MSRAITIDKGVPLPGSRTGRGDATPELRQALVTMDVGDSFLHACAARLLVGEQSRIMNQVAPIARETGRRFVSRKVEHGFRVWRVG